MLVFFPGDCRLEPLVLSLPPHVSGTGLGLLLLLLLLLLSSIQSTLAISGVTSTNHYGVLLINCVVDGWIDSRRAVTTSWLS
jgi:hypothetical protein